MRPIVSIVMGSDSDLPVMKEAAEILEAFDIQIEVSIVSAHRTPDRLMEFSKKAHERGIEVIIAGAGGAAHLPGMVAAVSPLPVIGVPILSSNSIDGWDSILSILNARWRTCATVALNGAKNAGILAAQMVGIKDNNIRAKLLDYKEGLKQAVNQKIEKLNSKGYKGYL